MQQAIQDTSVDATVVDDVILGNVVGPGGNIARVSLLQAGFPTSVPGVTVDRQCGAGLEAIMRGFEAMEIVNEDDDTVCCWSISEVEVQ